MTGVVFLCAWEHGGGVRRQSEINRWASTSSPPPLFCDRAFSLVIILCDAFFLERMIDAFLRMTQKMNGWMVSIRLEYGWFSGPILHDVLRVPRKDKGVLVVLYFASFSVTHWSNTAYPCKFLKRFSCMVNVPDKCTGHASSSCARAERRKGFSLSMHTRVCHTHLC